MHYDRITSKSEYCETVHTSQNKRALHSLSYNILRYELRKHSAYMIMVDSLCRALEFFHNEFHKSLN